MVKVKICGITNSKDALKAVSLGAWAIGFIFYKKSPRFIGPYKVKKIIQELPPFVTPVGVFVNQKEGAVKEIASFCGLRTLQFHGDESATYCKRFRGCKIIKALRVGEPFDPLSIFQYNVDAFLFDTFEKDVYGGTGKTFNWKLIKSVSKRKIPIILSGGITPDNVHQAIEEVGPYAVDVSSGVEEAPGKKSDRLLTSLFASI